jgi:hypothetical protein
MRVALSMALAMAVLVAAAPWCLRAERESLEGLDRRWRWALFVLLLGVLVARLLIPHGPLRCDDGEFLARAAMGWEQAAMSRAPGFPLLLAFFGGFTEISLDLAYLLNGVAAMAFPILAFVLGWRCFGSGAAAFGGALLATVHPLVFVHGQSSEYHVWANTFFLAVLALAMGYPQRPNRASLVAAAAAGALCVCFGVELVALVAPLLGWMLYVTWRERRGDWDVVAAVALSFALLATPAVQGLIAGGTKDGSLETAVDFAAQNPDSPASAAAAQVLGYVRDQVLPAVAAVFSDPELMPLVSALGLLGLVFLWGSRERMQALTATFLLAGLPLLYFGTHRGNIESHRHQLVLPLLLLAVLAGGALARILRGASRRCAWGAGGAAALLIAASLAWGAAGLDSTLRRNAAWSQSRAVEGWMALIPAASPVYVDDPARLSLFDPGRPWSGISALHADGGPPAGSWVIPGCNPGSCQGTGTPALETLAAPLEAAGRTVSRLGAGGRAAPQIDVGACDVALRVER